MIYAYVSVPLVLRENPFGVSIREPDLPLWLTGFGCVYENGVKMLCRVECPDETIFDLQKQESYITDDLDPYKEIKLNTERSKLCPQ